MSCDVKAHQAQILINSSIEVQNKIIGPTSILFVTDVYSGQPQYLKNRAENVREKKKGSETGKQNRDCGEQKGERDPQLSPLWAWKKMERSSVDIWPKIVFGLKFEADKERKSGEGSTWWSRQSLLIGKYLHRHHYINSKIRRFHRRRRGLSHKG